MASAGERANCSDVDCAECCTNDKRRIAQASQRQRKKANDAWDHIAKQCIAAAHDANDGTINAVSNV